MDLILWRHTEAEDALPDATRELTGRGRKQAARMADWLNPGLPRRAFAGQWHRIRMRVRTCL